MQKNIQHRDQVLRTSKRIQKTIHIMRHQNEVEKQDDELLTGLIIYREDRFKEDWQRGLGSEVVQLWSAVFRDKLYSLNFPQKKALKSLPRTGVRVWKTHSSLRFFFNPDKKNYYFFSLF